MKTRIYINGRFLTQNITGVQRYAQEIMNTLDQLIDTENFSNVNAYQFILVIPRRNIRHALSLKHIPILKAGVISGHLWEQLLLPFYTRKGLLFCPGNTAPFLSLFSKQRVVVTLHSLSYHYFPQSYSLLFRFWYQIMIPLVLKYADGILTVSNTERQQIIQYYPAAGKKITVIQNGGLPVTDQPSLPKTRFTDIEKRKPYLLYVGALSRGKNIQGVLNAFKKVAGLRDINLIVAGSSAAAFQKLNINPENTIINSIHFAGQVNHIDEMVVLYQHALCLLFPSFYEASPLPPIEAMACGCPVICSDIPALRERCGEAAVYCDPEDSDGLAARILSLYRDKALREAYRNKGWSQAKQFTWYTCTEQTINTILSYLK